MREAGYFKDWTNEDWFSDDAYLFVYKNNNLKTKAARYIESWRWRNGINDRLLKDIRIKAKKLRKHTKKLQRSREHELLRLARQFMEEHKYFYEDHRFIN